MASRQACKGEVDLKFLLNGTAYPIQRENISFAMIECNYQENILPTVYISMAVNSSMYTMITRNYESAHFILDIKKTNAFSDNAIFKPVIQGRFKYIPSTTSVNYTDQLNDYVIGADLSYRRITVGLVSMDQINVLRKNFNGIYKNVSQQTLINIALEGIKSVVETPKYNKTYDQYILPPVSSRYRMIENLFQKDSFYNTNFQFFYELDKRAYLVSKNGNPVNAGDGDPLNILIDIRDVTSEEVYNNGYEIRNGAYYIYISSKDTNVIVNEATEKIANRVVAIDDESKGVQNLGLVLNNSNDASTSIVYNRLKDAAIYKNELETNSVLVVLQKKNLDSNIFTLNKCINISHYGSYAKYNGRYILSYKREFYKLTAEGFVITTNIGLKRVSNIEYSMSNYDTVLKSSLAVKNSSITTSTSRSSIRGSSTKISRSSGLTKVTNN